MTSTFRAWSFIAWVAIAALARADEPATQMTSSAKATALVRIAYVLGSMQVNSDMVGALLDSAAVRRTAAEGLPNLPPNWEEFVSVGVESTGPPSIDSGVANSLFQISISITDMPSPPSGIRDTTLQLLHGFCRGLQQAMGDAGSWEQQRLSDLVAAREQDVEKAQSRLKELQGGQQRLLDAAGRTDLDRERISKELRELENKLGDLELKLVILHARQTALTEQIARLGKEVAVNVETDGVVQEFAKVVQLRERALQNFKEQQKEPQKEQQKEGGMFGGDATAGESWVGVEALALARAELAKQRQAAALTAGGQLLTELNKELLSLSVDLAEAEAERSALQQRLTNLRERQLLELADQYEREVQLTLPMARAAVEDASKQQLRAESDRSRYSPPRVLVMGQGR
jgi:hypothetical protein